MILTDLGKMVYFGECDVIEHYNHISSGDTKKYWTSVLCIFESVVLLLINDYPKIGRIYIQTDNEAWYQNGSLLLGMIVIPHLHGLKLQS